MRNIPQHSNVCLQPEQGSKRRRSAKRPVKKCTGFNAAHGFLNKTFPPIISRGLGLLGQPPDIEREFYRTLSNFSALYGLKIPPKNALGYPFNITHSFDAVKQQFEQKKTGLDLIILKDKTHKACITTVKTYDTGMNLYYIAVKPLASLMRNQRKKAQANLLLSVFAYLFQIAGMPYFEDGFVGGEYEMIYEWYSQDPRDYGEDDYNEIMNTYKEMGYFGKKMFKSIRHKYHLLQFEKRVQKFVPKTFCDNELLAVSSRILCIYKAHPARKIFDNVHYGFNEPQEEDRIAPDQYISFFWEAEGTVYDQLMECVNNCFQEISCIEEPIALQYFDKPQTAQEHNLAFEEAFFESLHQLSDLLDTL